MPGTGYLLYDTARNVPKYRIPVLTVCGTALNLPIYRIPVPKWFYLLQKIPVKTSGKHISHEESWKANWYRYDTVPHVKRTRIPYDTQHSTLSISKAAVLLFSIARIGVTGIAQGAHTMKPLWSHVSVISFSIARFGVIARGGLRNNTRTKWLNSISAQVSELSHIS